MSRDGALATFALRKHGLQRRRSVYHSLKSALCSRLLPSRLVIVWIRRYCFVIQEIGFVLGCTHTLEGPGWLVQIEEICQIRRSTVVGKGELTFWNPEVMLDETQNAAEVGAEAEWLVARDRTSRPNHPR